jgi:LEA14-like dessication related protein
MLAAMPRILLLVHMIWLGLAASHCSKPEPPRVSARNIQVTGTGPTGLDLTVELDVQNPNAFPLLVDSVEGTLALGSSGVEVGRGVASPKGSIPARGSSVVASQLHVGWANLAALAPFALAGTAVPYTFSGRARIGGKSLNVEVPFTLRGELTPEQLLQAGLRGLTAPAAPAP